MEEKKKGRVKEWLKENWPLLVYGGICGAVIGGYGYAIHKANKQAKELEEYWQTPEAWNQQAEAYRLMADQSNLMADYYEKSGDDLKVVEF